MTFTLLLYNEMDPRYTCAWTDDLGPKTRCATRARHDYSIFSATISRRTGRGQVSTSYLVRSAVAKKTVRSGEL
jgi:hypothetical protein